MIEDERLLTTEKDVIFKFVERYGLPVSCFEWKVNPRFEEPVVMAGITITQASVLAYAPSGFTYTFGKFYSQLFPGMLERVERRDVYKNGLAGRLRYRNSAVLDWLKRVKEEVNAPDLWTKMQENREFLGVASTSENTEHFTEKDKLFLSERFAELTAVIEKQHDLPVTQVNAIKHGFADIVKAMNSYGKKDWFNLATGILVNIAVNAMFAPAAANDLLQGLSVVVQPLFDVGVRLLSQPGTN
jgi:hypothetical protein